MVKRFVISAFLAVLASISMADYGRTELEVENIRLYVKVAIPGVTQAADPISGTNVSLSCASGAQFISASTSSVYSDAQLVEAKLTIGGEQIYNRTYAPGGAFALVESSPTSDMLVPDDAEIPQWHGPPPVRFASNRFSHNSTVLVRLQCKFRLTDLYGSHTFETVDAEINPLAYNKLAAWKTTVMSNGDAWPSEEQGRIDAIVALGASEFANANYGPDPSFTKSKNQALNALDVSTGVFANTHGSTTGITRTTGWNFEAPAQFLSWSEIATKTSGQPPHSWAILYACDTNQSRQAVQSAFRTSGIDKVHLGFDVILSTSALDFLTGLPVSFELHAAVLFDELNSGYKALDAVQKANQRFVPLTPGNTNAQMFLNGDSETTFKSVYLSLTERQTLAPNDWRYTPWFLVLG